MNGFLDGPCIMSGFNNDPNSSEPELQPLYIRKKAGRETFIEVDRLKSHNVRVVSSLGWPYNMSDSVPNSDSSDCTESIPCVFGNQHLRRCL